MGEIVIHQPPGHTISYFPSLTPIAGSMKAAILLQQIVYLTKRGHGHDRWITKDGGQQEWVTDTGLTLKEFNLALKSLVSKRLVDREYDRRNHQLRVRLRIDHYNKAVDEIPTEEPTPKHIPKRHMTKRHMPKGKMPQETIIDSNSLNVTLESEDEHMTKGHMPKGHMASSLLEDEHMTKGHFVCSKEEELLEATRQLQEKETPPEKANAFSSPPPHGEGDVPVLAKKGRQPRKLKQLPTYDPEGYQAFIAVFPRRAALPEAVKAWDWLQPDATLQATILADIATRKAQDRKWAEGFITHPATYLRGERWLDDITPRQASLASDNTLTPHPGGGWKGEI